MHPPPHTTTSVAPATHNSDDLAAAEDRAQEDGARRAKRLGELEEDLERTQAHGKDRKASAVGKVDAVQARMTMRLKELEKELAAVRDEGHTVKDALRNVTRECDAANRDLEKSRGELARLGEEVEAARGQTKSTKARAEDHVDAVRDVQRDLDRSRRELEAVKAELTEVLKKNKSRRSKGDARGETLARGEVQLVHFGEQQLASLRKELEDAKDTVRAERRNHKDAMHELKREVDASKYALEQREKAVATAESRLDEQHARDTGRIETLKTELDRARSHTHDRKASFMGKLTDGRDMEGKMRANARAIQAELDVMRRKLDKSTQDRSRLTEELETVRVDYGRVVKDMTALDVECEGLRAKQEKLRRTSILFSAETFALGGDSGDSSLGHDVDDDGDENNTHGDEDEAEQIKDLKHDLEKARRELGVVKAEASAAAAAAAAAVSGGGKVKESGRGKSKKDGGDAERRRRTSATRIQAAFRGAKGRVVRKRAQTFSGVVETATQSELSNRSHGTFAKGTPAKGTPAEGTPTKKGGNGRLGRRHQTFSGVVETSTPSEEGVKSVVASSNASSIRNHSGLGLLRRDGFPRGLAEEMMRTKMFCPLRYWLIDNSGSMKKKDGRRMGNGGGGHEKCSRWEELRDSIAFHSKLADVVGWDTEFRLINDPKDGTEQVVRIGAMKSGATVRNSRRAGSQSGVAALKASMNSEPRGKTPLCANLRAVHRELTSKAELLRVNGCKAIIVIATDGKPTDGDLGMVLKTFESLPVWVVVRLCTDEEDVVEYWNEVDERLDVGMDVLDDFEGEAQEVAEHNPWVNYSPPLHLAREGGLHRRAFDLLDERLLTPFEMWHFMQLLFGWSKGPDPVKHWDEFQKRVRLSVETEGVTWDPAKGKDAPWVYMRKFASEYQDVVNETSVWNREREDLLGRLRDTGRDVDLEEELADMEARLEDAREAVRQARGKAAAQVNELQVRCEYGRVDT